MRLFSRMCQFFLLVEVFAFLPTTALADSCEIDLENNTHNCQNIPAIIDLDPGKASFTEVNFNVEYKKKAVGWTVNIGDSIWDNGSD